MQGRILYSNAYPEVPAHVVLRRPLLQPGGFLGRHAHRQRVRGEIEGRGHGLVVAGLDFEGRGVGGAGGSASRERAPQDPVTPRRESLGAVGAQLVPLYLSSHQQAFKYGSKQERQACNFERARIYKVRCSFICMQGVAWCCRHRALPASSELTPESNQASKGARYRSYTVYFPFPFAP